VDQSFEQQGSRERLAGLLLILAAGSALIAVNSPLEPYYHALLHVDLGLTLPRVGALDLHLFVVDGLMAIFFLLIGMEVKREWFEGRLASRQARQLPVLAAIAGMAVPALVYMAVAWGHPEIYHGWAVPTATDIAFAIAVLAILGTHAPPSIKLFLIAVAIVDDVGAVALIALFYTDSLDTTSLAIGLGIMGSMATASMLGVRRSTFYLAGFALLWFFVLKSGVHATIAGVMAAATIPLGRGESQSTLESLEHRLHPWVMMGIVPLFGFVSAGVALTHGIGALLQPLPLAVALGLFLGKQIGVFTAIRVGSALGLCCKPDGASWPQIYGAAILTGIGFTMSLFIAGLAFEDPARLEAAKLGILSGSLMSALVGWLVLRLASAVPFFDDDVDEAERIFGQKRRADPTAPGPALSGLEAE
jgi:NhaA family Na+:H+ antiporter